MNTAEQIPDSERICLASVARTKKLFGWAALICAAIVVFPPLLGLIGTVMGMINAFSTLQITGGADPSALAADISVALLSMSWGLAASALALIPFIVFLVIFLKQRKILRDISRRR
jgi:biopolymer transport protein ExbB